MKISVIIPTFNGEKRICNTLNALLSQTNCDFELIIIIDGSSDRTIDLVNGYQKKFKQFIIIEQKNQGRANARNNAVKYSSGDLLIFFDDDMRPCQGSIQKHFDHYKNHQNTILVGNQLEDSAKMQMDFQKYKANLSLKWTNSLSKTKSVLDKPFISAANFSIGRTTFQKIGGFTNDLTDAEDYDLAIRANKFKIPIYFDPNLIGWHDDFVTCKKYILRQREYAKANEIVLKIHDLPNVFNSENLFKRIFFKFFTFKIWIRLIDEDKLIWLPKIFRYKLYDWVITSLGVYNPHVKIR